MSDSASEFPMEIKSGRVIVKIYNTPKTKDGKVFPGFTVDGGMLHGQRERYLRSNLHDAIKKAEEVAKKIANGEVAVLKLTAADVDILARCKRIIEPTGRAMETICVEYVQASGLLGNVSLTEAARCYLEHNRTSFVPQTISELLESYVEGKRSENLSELHLKNIRVFLKPAVEHFKCPIHKITAVEFNAWLAGLKDRKKGTPLSPQSRLNFRTALMAFFNSALARQHLPENWNAFKTRSGESLVIRPKVIKKAAKIYTPEEMTLLLYGAGGFIDLPTPEVKEKTKAEGKEIKPPTDEQKAALRELIPFLAIGAFGAVRTSLTDGEITELDWSDIDLVNDQINLDDGAAKVDDRYIKIQPNLKEWLLPFKKPKGSVVPPNPVRRRRLLCKLVGVPWKVNGLRKSFISYRLAQLKDAGKVADEAGNSPEMIYTRYRKALPEELGTRWFSIHPPKDGGNITSISDLKACA